MEKNGTHLHPVGIRPGGRQAHRIALRLKSMNVLHLEFDLSRADGVESDTDDLRRELASLFDEVLKRKGQGHWVASKIKGNLLQVKCNVHETDLARAQIKQALSGHWIISYLLPGH